MSRSVAIFLLFLVLLSISLRAQERWVTLAGSDDILNIPEGLTALLVGIPNKEVDFVYQKAGGNAVRFNLGATLRPDGDRGQVSSQSPMPLVGPATLKMANEAVIGLKMVQTISAPGSGSRSGSAMAPSSAVVIPSDATGPVRVLLESSVDLISWTAAEPGTYGASSTNRFFRIRAVAE